MDITKLDSYGRRITGVLFTAQGLYSAGNIMLFTISSIIAVQLGGDILWTGVPMTIQLLGSALAAWPLGRFSDHFGRRAALIIGQFCGIIGSITAGIAVIAGLLPVFLAGIFLLGFARGGLDMGRYAAADANPVSRRAKAISLVVLGGVAGSIISPPLLHIIEPFAVLHNMPPMSLPWFVMSIFLVLSFVMVFTFLRPDPSEIARFIAKNDKYLTKDSKIIIRPLSEIMKDKRFFLAICSIISGHLVMYLVMTVTPVFMNGCHYQVSSISWVIFAHSLGMYGLSFLIGTLIDRLGRIIMIFAGSIILIIACLLAPFSSETAGLTAILFLVGLGWNCCFVTGSTLLSDCLRPGERGNLQGMVDTFVNVAAGTSSLGSGLLFAALGFSSMLWITLSVAILPIVFILVLFVNTLLKKNIPVLEDSNLSN